MLEKHPVLKYKIRLLKDRGWRIYRLFIQDQKKAGALHPSLTYRIGKLESYLIESENKDYGVQFEPVNLSAFNAVISHLEIDYSEWHFIDLGCGNGTAVRMAKEFGFRSYTGVDFVPELIAEAKENFPFAEFHLMDVADFFPKKDKSVFFLFNPFKEEVLKKVLKKMVDFEGEVVVAYVNNPYKELFQSFQQIYSANDPLGLYGFNSCAYFV